MLDLIRQNQRAGLQLFIFKKSVRHVKCNWSRIICEVTIDSRSLYFTSGGRWTLENNSSRVNSFMLADWPPNDLPRCVPSEFVNLSVLDAIPIDSSWVRP